MSEGILYKKCKFCKKDKPLNCFKDDYKKGKLYKNSNCIECTPIFNREYYLKNIDRYRKKAINYNLNNKEKVRESQRKWHLKNREKILEKNKIRYNKENKHRKKTMKHDKIPNINDRFGKWTVIDNTIIMLGKEPRRAKAITCKCDCGNVCVVRVYSLSTGKSVGCKCLSGEVNRTKCKKNSVGDLSRTQFAHFRNGAERRDISWQLSMQFLWDLFLKQNRKCIFSGIELSLSVKIPRKSITNNASLDRIDSTKSYTEDNVQWVHKDINKMKSNLTDERFIELCKLVGNHNK